MTDEQIVKALECCVSSAGGDACRRCPYEDEGICVTDGLALQRDSLALIKRQQAEIERLQKESADKERAYTDEFCCRKEWQRKCRDLLEEKIEARANAVREFAEKLKKWKYQSSDWSHGEHPFVVEETDIDELVIEMTEKEGGKG